MSSSNASSPINPLPWVVWALFLPIAALELIFNLAQSGLFGNFGGAWRLLVISQIGFVPEVLERVVLRGDWSLDMLARFVAYPFAHLGLSHAAFAGVLLLALGKFVGEVFRGTSVLIVFFGAAIFGAFIYGALSARAVPLVGAYPPVYGLIGAYTYLLWLRLEALGQNQIAAFSLIAFLMAIQLVFALLFGGDPTWIADVSGFVFGLAISPLVAPGGWSAFVRRMRGD